MDRGSQPVDRSRTESLTSSVALNLLRWWKPSRQTVQAQPGGREETLCASFTPGGFLERNRKT
uniref:Uncharacterized protein n=1 Tax=Anopheles atroparvus TaxID=41427 RepID=A0AAG5DRT2_ANOAO